MGMRGRNKTRVGKKKFSLGHNPAIRLLRRRGMSSAKLKISNENEIGKSKNKQVVRELSTFCYTGLHDLWMWITLIIVRQRDSQQGYILYL